MDFKQEISQGLLVAGFLVSASGTLRREHRHSQFDHGWHEKKVEKGWKSMMETCCCIEPHFEP